MEILNHIETHNTEIEEIRLDKKAYYICNVCGRASFRKVRAHHKTYCDKHYKQFKRFGHPIDTNPHTLYDRNEIYIDEEIAYIDLYNAHGDVVAQAIIDAEDVPKVRYIKWKLSSSGYAMNMPKYKNSNLHMSRIILGTEEFVDHVNHNKLDNRKCNLRVVTRSQNQMNANYKGVSKNNNKFYAHIKINQKIINLGTYVFEDEALFARWYAETQLFGEYRYPKKKPFILPDREKQIVEYVDKKLQRL